MFDMIDLPFCINWFFKKIASKQSKLQAMIVNIIINIMLSA